MNENIKAFLQKLSEDEALAAKFSALKDPEEAYAIASEAVGGFTKEEFVSAMEEVVKASMGSSGELSDEDLKKVAGGAEEETDIVSCTVSASAFSLTSVIGSAAIGAAI